MRLGAALLGLALVAAPACAEEMARSPRPEANPRVAGALPAVVVEPGATVLSRSPLPQARPQSRALAAAATDAAAAEPITRVLRPRPRPAAIAELTAAVAEVQKPRPFLSGLLRPRPRPADEAVASAEDPPPRKRREPSRKGSVCGVAAIKGEPLAPIRSQVSGCGVAEPVRVTSVSGVTLSQAASIDCETARALNTWVDEVVQPAFGNREVVELQVAAHYVCRGRNNKRGAKISEHGKGRAIDISAFRLADGTLLTVAKDYNRTLRRVHAKACGIFGTTLGPGSDGYHEDHIHLDTARHGNGPLCG